MARTVGDTNLSLREKRKDAQNAVLKAKIAAKDAQLQVKNVRIMELTAKLKAAKK